MPRYEVTSPDGKKFEVTAPEGASQEDVVAYAQAQFAQQEPRKEKAPERSMLDSLGRQIGLRARAGIGGVAGIANALADPAVVLANRLGANLPIPSQALERTMTRAGLPQPQGGPEEFAQATARGMVVPGAAAKALPQFAAGLGTQTVASGLAAGSSDLAGQAGAGPMGQFAAGIAGGVIPTTAGASLLEAGKMARNGLPAMIDPLTAEGRKRIVARAMQGAASDKDAAARNAQGAPEYVPGSTPTLGEASQDIGLGLMEKAVRNRNPEAFATREAERDAARQSGLQKSFGTQTDITMAEQARDAATAPMREAAFANATGVDTRPVVKLGNSLLKAGAQYRGTVGPLLEKFVSDVKTIKDPEVLYNGPRKAINDVLTGKVGQDNPLAQFTKTELIALRSEMDNVIEKAAPGFKDYLKTYAGMSREIDKAALGQEITAASRSPINERLMPANFTRQFEKRGEEIANAGPVASDSLSRVAMDLRRAAAPMASGKTAGSDTLQNMVANSMLQRAGVNGGGPIQNAATRAAGLLYKPFGVEDATQEILRDAFLDPKQGAWLLQMQLKRNPLLLTDILKRLRAAPYGGLLGSAVANE